MRAVHLATMDRGGAGVAARRLNCGLGKIGVDSKMIVAQRHTSLANVESIEVNDSSLLGRLRRRIDSSRFARQRRTYAQTAPSKMAYVSDDRVPGAYNVNNRLPEADIYNLHWVVGLVEPRRFFTRYPSGRPLVWTLHDMNPLTGGCFYAFDCFRFTEKCGFCPQLGSQIKDDLSAQSQARKALAYSKLLPETTRIVAPSKWLGVEASRSSLMGGFSLDVIPYGIDTDTFTPRRKNVAREVFSIPGDDLVIAFAADIVELPIKGFDLLREAMVQLSVGRPVTLALIGRERNSSDAGTRTIGLGRIQNERLMSFALSAADLFVTPTRADNLPNVILEAMACGLPVVGFDVGGVPDMVRPGKTGLLAPPEDTAALRRAIETLLNNDDLRARMSAECRQIAVSEYALAVQARRYKALYESLIDSSARLSAEQKHS